MHDPYTHTHTLCILPLLTNACPIHPHTHYAFWQYSLMNAPYTHTPCAFFHYTLMNAPYTYVCPYTYGPTPTHTHKHIPTLAYKHTQFRHPLVHPHTKPSHPHSSDNITHQYTSTPPPHTRTKPSHPYTVQTPSPTSAPPHPYPHTKPSHTHTVQTPSPYVWKE